MLLNRFGVPFVATLPIVVVVCGAVGVVLERTLYRRLYGASHLDQVLFSIGLVFVSIATATYFFGSQQQPLRLPDALRGQLALAGHRHRRLSPVPDRRRPRRRRRPAVRCS